MNLAKWSLEKVQFLLSHVEELVDDDSDEIRERISQFEPQTGLGKLEALGADPSDPALALRVFEKLAPFYEAGLLLQQSENWRLSDFFWKGQIFSLEPNEQIDAGKILVDISPLQVSRTPAIPLLRELALDFVRVPPTALSFLFRPASQVSFILISDLPEIWSGDHVQSTQRLLNKSFIF